MIRFEWDDNKNSSNIRKHKISFIEAKTVFFDENALLICDPDHSKNEIKEYGEQNNEKRIRLH